MITKKNRRYLAICFPILIAAVTAFLLLRAVSAPSPNASVWTFVREVPVPEQELRLQLVQTAKNWLGCQESDGSHIPILDIYNGHTPLARGYAMQPQDDWCSAFASAAAIQSALTQIIPTEVGCQEHIYLFQSLGRWQEEDGYVPLPGDYIFYCGQNCRSSDCTCYSNHVGIVAGTYRNWILVIEGNHRDAVAYRRIRIDDAAIRGFGLPDYGGFTHNEIQGT